MEDMIQDIGEDNFQWAHVYDSLEDDLEKDFISWLYKEAQHHWIQQRQLREKGVNENGDGA